MWKNNVFVSNKWDMDGFIGNVYVVKMQINPGKFKVFQIDQEVLWQGNGVIHSSL